MIGENLLSPEPTWLAAETNVIEAFADNESAELVVKQYPESPLAWATLANEADAAGRVVESYAFARVGYHRGLDALRRAGWRGTGPVPWDHEPNRGVLLALFGLRRAAEQIGETAEVERLTEFLDGADAQAISQIEGHLARTQERG